MSAGYLAKCARKKRHVTQSGAEAQRSSMVAAGTWTLSESNTYWCNQCGHWHAGHLGRNNRGKGRKTAKNTLRHLDSQ